MSKFMGTLEMVCPKCGEHYIVTIFSGAYRGPQHECKKKP